MNDEALKAAYLAGFKASGEGYNGEYPFYDNDQNIEEDAAWCKGRDSAITAIKQARALDKMAENARELGLDYEPAKYSDIVSDGGLDPRNKFDAPRAAQPAPVQEPIATDWERIARVQDAKLRAMCNDPTAFEQLCEIMDRYEALRPTPPAAQRQWVGLTEREIELLDGMIAVQLDHAARCDSIANRTMAEKQKGWDMERVALLQKLKEKNT